MTDDIQHNMIVKLLNFKAAFTEKNFLAIALILSAMAANGTFLL